MPNRLISIMGTNGSGKSTLMKKFLPDDAKVIKHPLSTVYDCGTHFVIGRYDTDCGGLDGLKDFYDVIPLVKEFIQQKDVFVEGVLFGGIYKTPSEIDDMITAEGHSYFWVKIEITAQQCADSVLIRRIRNGNFKDFDPAKLVNKYNGARSSFNKAIDNNRLGFYGSRDECETVIRNLLLNDDRAPFLTKRKIEGPNLPGKALPVLKVTPELREKYYASTDLSSMFD